MSQSKFLNIVSLEELREKFGDPIIESPDSSIQIPEHPSSTIECNPEISPNGNDINQQKLTGRSLRSFAFAKLSRKELSKKELTLKLLEVCQDKEEALGLVEELSNKDYQSDQRLAEMVVRSQVRKGKGPNRIKMVLNEKHVNKELIKEDLDNINWYEEAYQLKVKKYGYEVTKDPKVRAKQIRFLMYRGFEMDAIMKAISRKSEV